MSKFGWSYPPGCSGTPYDQEQGVSELQDAVLDLLEDAGIDVATNDAIVKLIDAAEQKKWREDAGATALAEGKP